MTEAGNDFRAELSRQSKKGHSAGEKWNEMLLSAPERAPLSQVHATPSPYNSIFRYKDTSQSSSGALSVFYYPW